MDRLAEQVVAWHNRHPLAKRITIYDVHTIGVVALPFMRNAQADGAARQAGTRGKVEPVLTDEISPESLAAAWDEEGLTIAVNPNAAHLDALADQEPPPRQPKPSWPERLSRLAFWRQRADADGKSWPVFSERFVSHVSPRRIAAFALAQGYTKQPGDASWPQRIVPIDEQLMSNGAAAGSGAWPFELYLMSAAIDAGRSRSRILLGRGAQPAITGRRCLSPQRLGLLALIVIGLLGAGAALLRPSPKNEPLASAPVPAIAASAAVVAAASPTEAASAASAPASVAVAVVPEASAPADSPATTDALEPKTTAPEEPPRPDIRPMFVKPIPGRTAPPLGAPPKDEQLALEKETPKVQPEPAPEPLIKPKAKSTLAHASKPKLTSEPPPAAAPAASKTPATTPPSGKAMAKAQALVNKPVVALVGPVSANKTEAEATLARMVTMLGPAQGGAGGPALQAQVFQTPEGWRPAVWPFASREEAQLINATLIARGMRTRAVDF